MIETTITCDNCLASGPLENHNGVQAFRVPKGWIQVKPQVMRYRSEADSLLNQMTQAEINTKIKGMVPMIHLCEDCVVDKNARDVITERQVKKEKAKLERDRAKEQKELEKQNRAVVEVTRTSGGRRLLMEDEHGS